MMHPRPQQTLRRCVELTGIGFFTGADVTVRLLPADEHHGIRFRRSDLSEQPVVPAHIAFLTPSHRRTALACKDARVELTEHLLAALAGLRVDNCLVDIDAPELPGGDGSARLFVDAIDRAEIVTQQAPREVLTVTDTMTFEGEKGATATASPDAQFSIAYHLDYGDGPIPPQSADGIVTPDFFRDEIASARTFVLESEIAALRAAGYGTRVSPADLLVFGEAGPLHHTLIADNECARHKLLDCIGDFALAGADLVGRFKANRSGHALNHELVRRLVRQATDSKDADCTVDRAA